MAVATSEEFFAILQKSKLLTPSQLAQARELAREGDDPTAIAKALARRDLITRWQAGQLLAGRSSFYLGKYRLIELLGRGGMGSVFLGQHVTMNRRVALKIISRQVRKDRASLDRFLAEARAIATLDHPNIVQVYSVDNEGDRYYMVMEYVEGLDLERLVEEDGPLECRQAAEYVRQAAEGLDHAHQRNMIHCDIKPSNLLVNVQGVVKILDMGLARLMAVGKGDRSNLCEAPSGPFRQIGPVPFSDPEAGSGGGVLGSVDYLAPEQAIEGPDLDGRADIYSLGCTFYFLLTGHPPFPQGTLAERILKHQTQEPSPIRAERPGVPAELAAICAKMMAKRPEDRYQSAGEVGRVLAAWRSAAPTLKRAVPLVRARPLEESPGEGLPQIKTNGEARRPAPGKRDSGILRGKPLDGASPAGPTAPERGSLKRISAKLFATPLHIVGVASAVLLVVLGTAAVVMVLNHGPGNPATPSPTPSGKPLAAEAASPPQAKPAKPGPSQPEPLKPTKPSDQPLKRSAPEGPGPLKPGPADLAAPKTGLTPKPSTGPGPAKPRPDRPPVAPPPAKAPPKVEPLKDFAEAVDLPPSPEGGGPPPAADKLALGKVRLVPGANLDITLLGGTDVPHGGCRFVLDRDAADSSGTAWLVRGQTESKTGASPARHDVARLWLDGQTLSFAWLPGAAGVPADYLRNCGLLVAAGEVQRYVALCRPQPQSPLVLDTDRPVAKPNFKRLNLPDPGVLRLQITGFSSDLPGPTMMPSDTVGAKNKIDVSFSDPKLPKVLLRVRFEPKAHSVQIELSLLWQPPGQTRLMPLRIKEVERIAAQTEAGLRQANAAWTALSPMDPRRGPAEEELKQLTAKKGQLDALSRLCEAIGQNGKIYFRVFALYGKREVTLLSAPPPARAGR